MNLRGRPIFTSSPSSNALVREKLGWDYEQTLEEGIRKTYAWIKEQVDAQKIESVEENFIEFPDGSVEFVDEVCSV